MKYPQRQAGGEEAPVADEDVPPVVEPADDDPIVEPATATPRGTPREAIREFALANPHLVDEFFKGVLAATQAVWMTCKHCKHRSQVEVPTWSARTKVVELRLEQGFGKPEPRTPRRQTTNSPQPARPHEGDAPRRLLPHINVVKLSDLRDAAFAFVGPFRRTATGATSSFGRVAAVSLLAGVLGPQ